MRPGVFPCGASTVAAAVSSGRCSAGGVAPVQVDMGACHARGRPAGALGVKPGVDLGDPGADCHLCGSRRRTASPREREREWRERDRDEG